MKKWLVNSFLPLWAKETVLRENRRLKKENHALQQKLAEVEAYALGLRIGLRAVTRVRSSGGEK